MGTYRSSSKEEGMGMSPEAESGIGALDMMAVVYGGDGTR